MFGGGVETIIAYTDLLRVVASFGYVVREREGRMERRMVAARRAKAAGHVIRCPNRKV
jgi:hypothetical protein